MKKILVCFILCASMITAQKYDNYIKGRIIEKQTGKPLPGVNVYLNETLSGTTSDETGNFKIYSITPGNHELVASMIGYEVYNQNITVKVETKLEQNIFLAEKVYEFGTVEVTSEKSNEWIADYEKFSRMFLGANEFSAECEIMNKYYIDFENKGSVFMAKSKVPLIIENKALGYKIKCDLVQFRYDEAANDLRYVVKTFFEEYDSDKNEISDLYVPKRRQAYYGSLQHFLHSLVKGDVDKEGFEMRAISTPNKDEFLPPGFKVIPVNSILKPDKTGLFSRVSFKNYLLVKYQGEFNNMNKLSYLTLNYPEVCIDEFGAPLEVVPFKTIGSWAKYGLADMLPKYYIP